MNATEVASFLSTEFEIQIVVDADLGLAFAEPQSAHFNAALSNIVEALRVFDQLNEIRQGGERYRLLRRVGAGEWKVTQLSFAVCNDAVIKAAERTTADPLFGAVMVYDALNGREIITFPAGGLT
jgi:hypothetical protein